LDDLFTYYVNSVLVDNTIMSGHW